MIAWVNLATAENPLVPPLPELKVAVKGGRPLSYVATALIAAAAGVGGALLLG